MNLLRSLYLDFYFKVILTSVTNGVVVWGSCSKSLFDEREKLHVCAAKIILWPGLVHTQRSGLSPNQVFHC